MHSIGQHTTIIKILCVLSGLFGCSKSVEDSASFIIAPGVGVKGVIELNMCPSDIKYRKKLIHIEKALDTDFLSGIIPYLGITFGGISDTPQINVISCIVSDDVILSMPKLALPLPAFERAFKGKTEQGLDFSQLVTRDDVILLYGYPAIMVTEVKTVADESSQATIVWHISSLGQAFSTDSPQEYYMYRSQWMSENLPFSFITNDDDKSEVLWYSGIIFTLNSNQVATVTITPFWHQSELGSPH